jgi:hypothetical protein
MKDAIHQPHWHKGPMLAAAFFGGLFIITKLRLQRLYLGSFKIPFRIVVIHIKP